MRFSHQMGTASSPPCVGNCSIVPDEQRDDEIVSGRAAGSGVTRQRLGYP